VQTARVNDSLIVIAAAAYATFCLYHGPVPRCRHCILVSRGYNCLLLWGTLLSGNDKPISEHFYKLTYYSLGIQCSFANNVLNELYHPS